MAAIKSYHANGCSELIGGKTLGISDNQMSHCLLSRSCPDLSEIPQETVNNVK